MKTWLIVVIVLVVLSVISGVMFKSASVLAPAPAPARLVLSKNFGFTLLSAVQIDADPNTINIPTVVTVTTKAGEAVAVKTNSVLSGDTYAVSAPIRIGGMDKNFEFKFNKTDIVEGSMWG